MRVVRGAVRVARWPTLHVAHLRRRPFASHASMQQHDETQMKLMEELCIMVDERDNITGFDTKKNAHLVARGPPLHRAFSIFLFSEDGSKLLLQQRASQKITFPTLWTNTVCSHPLKEVTGYGEAAGSDESDGLAGVLRAAQRKIKHEVGIDVDIADFTYLTRIHYLAPSDETWGEHEIDYILFVKKRVTYDLNPNEVSAVQYVTQDELRAFFKRTDVKFTPWFKLIVENFIYKWWDALQDGTLQAYVNAERIYKP